MFGTLIDKLRRRQDLSVTEAAEVMEEIMAGTAAPAQVAGLLVALSMKGERPSELVGLATTMRANARKLSKSYDALFDTCGTGGDGASTFNVSSLTALVLAGCGVQVAKHGNRAVSSRCGSADLFTALGVSVDAEPAIVERCLDDCGIAFLFAPTFHPSMRHAAQVRRDLGIRTVFNLLGPLTNPAGVRRQLVGVPRADLTDLVARALGELGAERTWVVHGADGLDGLGARVHRDQLGLHDIHDGDLFVHGAADQREQIAMGDQPQEVTEVVLHRDVSDVLPLHHAGGKIDEVVGPDREEVRRHHLPDGQEAVPACLHLAGVARWPLVHG